MPQFWLDYEFAAPFLGLFMFGGDVVQCTKPARLQHEYAV